MAETWPTTLPNMLVHLVSTRIYSAAARGARGAAQSLSEHTCRSPRWRAPRDTSPTMLQALVEAALQGQDQRLVARCDVGGIVTAFEDFGVYDPDTLRSTLHASMPALQLALGGTAPPSFLPLLKTKLGEQETPAPPEAAAGACMPNVQLPTPSPAPPALAAQLHSW